MKDNTEKAYLEYCFLVPTGVWSSIYDFEKDIARFLESLGLEATILNNYKGAVGYKRILDLNKKPTIPATPPQSPQTTNQGAVSQKLKEISGDSPNIKPQGRVRMGVIKPQQKYTVPQMKFIKGKKMKRKDYLQRKAY